MSTFSLQVAGLWSIIKKTKIHSKIIVPDHIWAPGYAQISGHISPAALSEDVRASLTSSPQLQLSTHAQQMNAPATSQRN